MFLHDAFPALALTFVPARFPAPPSQFAGDWSSAARARCAALLRQESRELELVVRTDALVRDLDLLVALDRRHAVTIRMLVATLDERLARRLEGGAPKPADRLAAVAVLAAEGLDTRVVLAPLFPGVNDGAAALRRFVEAAREAGATDVELGPERHRGLLGRRLDKPPAHHVRGLFERLRLEYGFPRAHAGRG
jgi:DNA repair photolyase